MRAMSDGPARHQADITTRAALILVLAGCSAPAPSLNIAFAGPPSQACPSTACGEVPMKCPAVMGIRIIDPADPDPEHPMYPQCTEMTPNGHKNMCVVANVDLMAPALPVRDLEVQVAVFPRPVISVDPADMNHLLCPNNVQYTAATGFPVEQAPTPALGGRAFYHPGDQAVTVTLGCTDLDALNSWCAGSQVVQVTASLENFKDRFPVTDLSVVDRLEVSAGEPRAVKNVFELNPTATTPLTLQNSGNGRPAWVGEITSPLIRYVCLKVRDNTAESTATATCMRVTPDQPLGLVGELLEKPQLDSVVKALLLPEFPPQGLTIGVVVDQVGDPVPGAVVAVKQHAVAYQATDGEFSGTATSDLGVFVSTDAPFGSEFSTDVVIGGTRQTLTGIGGLIEGMATVVILRPPGRQL
jgi:hypothetical protein